VEERSSLSRDSVKINEGWSLAGDKSWKKEILEVTRPLHHETTSKIIAITVLRIFTDCF